MEDETPKTETVDVTAEETSSGAEPVRSMLDELRGMGGHFASAMRAAAGTPEAEELKSDLQDGLRDLRGEIDKALQSAKASTPRAASSGKAVDQVRVELAAALRTLNRVLDRAAESLARPVAEHDLPDEPPGTPPTADQA